MHEITNIVVFLFQKEIVARLLTSTMLLMNNAKEEKEKILLKISLNWTESVVFELYTHKKPISRFLCRNLHITKDIFFLEIKPSVLWENMGGK